MPKVTLYIAASLDGYIARSDGGIDWLAMVEVPGEDYGYENFYSSVDAIALGSKTYELALSFEEWPYSGKSTFVFTQRALPCDRDDVALVIDPVETLLARLDTQGFQHLWLVGGGTLVNSFLQQDLIGDYIISTIPIILGEGIPLFPPPSPQVKLQLVSAKQYPSGLLQSHYRSAAKASSFG